MFFGPYLKLIVSDTAVSHRTMNGLTGLELARFTQLKRHTRFDDFVIMVWGQGSMFDIAVVSRPVQ